MSEASNSDSEPSTGTPDRGSATPAGETVVQLAKRDDGMFQATQQGLDIHGIGNSAARATEDMARQIADAQERGEL